MAADPARPPRIAFLTQVVDPDDPVLGFVVAWCEALSQHSDLLVVANEVRHVPPGLDGCVVSLGKENGTGTWRRVRRLRKVLNEMGPPPDVVFAHMCPPYLIAAATTVPALRAQRVLWYTHPASTNALRLAHVLAQRVLTALPSSYPIPARKVRAVGHAIDVQPFLALEPRRAGTPLRLIALGRTSSVKRLGMLIEAVALVRRRGIDVTLDIVGPSTTPSEAAHREELGVLLRSLELEDAVAIRPGLSHSLLPGLLADYDVLLNATQDGSADKVVFEAMAAARHVIVTNDDFLDLLESAGARELLARPTAEGVAAAIEAVAGRSPAGARLETAALRSVVVAEHSLQTLAPRVLTALGR